MLQTGVPAAAAAPSYRFVFYLHQQPASREEGGHEAVDDAPLQPKRVAMMLPPPVSFAYLTLGLQNLVLKLSFQRNVILLVFPGLEYCETDAIMHHLLLIFHNKAEVFRHARAFTYTTAPTLPRCRDFLLRRYILCQSCTTSCCTAQENLPMGPGQRLPRSTSIALGKLLHACGLESEFSGGIAELFQSA